MCQKAVEMPLKLTSFVNRGEGSLIFGIRTTTSKSMRTELSSDTTTLPNAQDWTASADRFSRSRAQLCYAVAILSYLILSISGEDPAIRCW